MMGHNNKPKSSDPTMHEEMQVSPPAEDSSHVDIAAQNQNICLASGSNSTPPVGSTLVERLARDIAGKLTADGEENANTIRSILKYFEKDVEKEYLTGLRSAPESIAASELVTNPQNWDEWALSINTRLHGFCVYDTVSSEVGMVKQNILYPAILKSLEPVETPVKRNIPIFVKAIKKWVAEVTDNDKVNWEPATDQRPLWGALLLDWSITKDAVSSGDNEAAQCLLANSMMILIFSQSVPDEGQYKVMLEKDLALPRPQKDQAGVKVPSSARSDIIVMKELPNVIAQKIEIGLARTSLFVSTVDCLLRPTTRVTYLGVFPVEAKCRQKEDAQRQVAMDLSSIQYQRRALSFKDKSVYGATIVNNHFELLASIWVESSLRVMPTEGCSWNLVEPIEFIQCLYFLHSLKTHIDAGISEDFESFDGAKFVAHLREDWRARPADRSNKRRKETQGDKSKKRRLGGGQEDADEDADMDGSNESLLTPLRIPGPFHVWEVLEYAMEQNRKRASRINDWRADVPPQIGEDIQIYEDEGPSG